jgi:hypothetical protein
MVDGGQAWRLCDRRGAVQKVVGDPAGDAYVLPRGVRLACGRDLRRTPHRRLGRERRGSLIAEGSLSGQGGKGFFFRYYRPRAGKSSDERFAGVKP